MRLAKSLYLAQNRLSEAIKPFTWIVIPPRGRKAVRGHKNRKYETDNLLHRKVHSVGIHRDDILHRTASGIGGGFPHWNPDAETITCHLHVNNLPIINN